VSTTIDPDAYDVIDYRTGESLPGLPSADLVRASLATPEGAISAIYDADDHRWHYPSPGYVSPEPVRVVYVVLA
jgi:hypothetical protein